MAATSTVLLYRGNNTTCIINLHGATVISWKVNNEEQFFVSTEVLYNGKSHIRGGVTLAFPHYGPWSFGTQHGFARIILWNVEKAPVRHADGDIEAIFSVTDNNFTRSMWDYPFKLTNHIVLKEKELHFNITVQNSSEDLPFHFGLLLHSYFRVPDVRTCQIFGLQGCTFVDKTREDIVCQESRDVLTIEEWIDRVYRNTPEMLSITNVGSDKKIIIQKYNFPDTVVWNPWTANAKHLHDLGDEEYMNLLCVEAGHVSNPVILLPEDGFQASVILQIM